MKRLLSLLVIVTSFTAVFATPWPRNSGFSLSVSKASRSKRDFVSEWAAVRQKWGKGIPESVLSDFSLLDNNGQVTVQPLGSDDIYIADIQVGTPPQTLKVALDTGSSDFWVQSTDTIYRTNENGPWAPRYKPNASRTARRLKEAEWDVEYVDGTSANGIVYLDTVRLGSLELPQTAIQSARTVASRFEAEAQLSGIMGLAKRLPSNVRPATPSVLDRLRPHLADPVFAVDLRRNASGRFSFGRVDGAFAGRLAWLPSRGDSPHWDVTFRLTAWRGGADPAWWEHAFDATIDTGTTLLFLPPALAQKYWASVPRTRADPRLAGSYTFPCAAAPRLPDLLFRLPRILDDDGGDDAFAGRSGHPKDGPGGNDQGPVLTIPGPYLNYGPTDTDPAYCWGGLQSSEDLDTTIFGDIMLKALYVAFDIDKNRVGFANKPLDDLDELYGE